MLLVSFNHPTYSQLPEGLLWYPSGHLELPEEDGEEEDADEPVLVLLPPPPAVWSPPPAEAGVVSLPIVVAGPRLPAVTVTVPTMFGCSRQKYGTSPASVNECSNVAAGADIPESNLPSGCPF